jgi:O-antigen ligase
MPVLESEATSAIRLRLPVLMLCLAILAVSVARWPLFTLSGIPVQWIDAAIALVYLALLLELVRTRELPRLSPIAWPTVGFVAVLALSCLVSPHPLRSCLKLVGFLPYLILPVIGATIIRTHDDMRLVVWAWWLSLGVSVCVCLITIIVFYSDRQWAAKYLMCGYGGLPTLPVPRLCAPFANQNALFNHLLSGLCIFAVTAYRRYGLKKTLLAYGALVSLSALTVSAGLAGLAVSSTVLLIWGLRYNTGALRAIKWLAIAGSALFVVAVALSLSGEVVHDGSGHVNVGSVGYSFGEAARPPIWRGAAKTFAAHPLLGIGYGESPGVTNNPRAWRVHDHWGLPHDGSFRTMDAHNVWLNVAGQAGILGLLAFLWLVRALWLQAQRGRRRQTGSGLSLADGLAAALLGWLVHSFSGSFEEARELWILFAMVVALAAMPKLADVDPAGTEDTAMAEPRSAGARRCAA